MAGAPQAAAHWQPLPPSRLVTAGTVPLPTPLNLLPLRLQAGHSLALGWSSLVQSAQTRFTFSCPSL